MACGPLPVELCWGKTTSAAGSRGLRTDGDRLFHPNGYVSLRDLGTDAANLDPLWLKDVLIRDEDSALDEVGHHMWGDEVTRAIEARFAVSRVEFLEVVSN